MTNTIIEPYEPYRFPQDQPFACRGGAHPGHTNGADCDICRAYLEWTRPDAEVYQPTPTPTPTKTWIREHRNEMFAVALQNAEYFKHFEMDCTNHQIEESFDTLKDFLALVGIDEPSPPEGSDVNPLAVRIAYLEEILHVVVRNGVRRIYAGVTCERWLDGSEFDISAFDLIDGKLAPQLAFALEHADEYGLEPSDILMDASEVAGSVA